MCLSISQFKEEIILQTQRLWDEEKKLYQEAITLDHNTEPQEMVIKSLIHLASTNCKSSGKFM